MHSIDVFANGHKQLMHTLDGIAPEDTAIRNVCGEWSVKDIMAHLTSFEQVLGDLLLALQGKAPDTVRLHDFIYHADFNDVVVKQSQRETYAQILSDYEQAHQRAYALLADFPEDLRTMSGLIAWYGDQYDLDDFIAYTYYGHKVEHAAQIAVFHETHIRKTHIT